MEEIIETQRDFISIFAYLNVQSLVSSNMAGAARFKEPLTGLVQDILLLVACKAHV
jgi:hypothetical protein